METLVSRLTVQFEAPFWVGLYERVEEDRYTVCKITFGAEPKDYEVYAFLLQNWHRLSFSPSIQADAHSSAPCRNPKRMQRQIRRELTAGIGTKAQQALKQQQAEGKQARQKRTRQQREAESDRQFALRQKKHKEKHKGH